MLHVIYNVLPSYFISLTILKWGSSCYLHCVTLGGCGRHVQATQQTCQPGSQAFELKRETQEATRVYKLP